MTKSANCCQMNAPLSGLEIKFSFWSCNRGQISTCMCSLFQLDVFFQNIKPTHGAFSSVFSGYQCVLSVTLSQSAKSAEIWSLQNMMHKCGLNTYIPKSWLSTSYWLLKFKQVWVCKDSCDKIIKLKWKEKIDIVRQD